MVCSYIPECSVNSHVSSSCLVHSFVSAVLAVYRLFRGITSLTGYPRIPRLTDDQCDSPVISSGNRAVSPGWTRMTSNDIAFGVEQMMSLPAESTVATSRSETSDEQFNYLGLYLHQSALFLQDCKKKIVSLISDRVLLIFPSRFETLDRFQGDC